MKNIFLLSVVLIISCAQLNAQYLEDALRLSRSNYTGTARSISMGNAFGALGGDLTGISINPAGIAVYRSSEFAFSPSLIINQTESDYYGSVFNDDKYRASFNQIGYVATFKPMRESTEGIISTHFGITYNRNNNFNQKLQIVGSGVNSTLLDVFVLNSNGYTNNELDPLAAKLAWETFLINQVSGTNDQYWNEFELEDEADKTIYWRAVDGINQQMSIEKTGYSGDYTVHGGMNISNQLMLGASITMQSYNYSYSSVYRESNNGLTPSTDKDLSHYDYRISNDQDGIGFNFKIGAIYKPINMLRVGLAYHSPTFFKIDESFDYSMNSSFLNGDNYTYRTTGDYKYNFQTPGKWIGSVAVILGKKALISLDAERVDYSSAKFRNLSIINDAGLIATNEGINNYFNAAYNFRAGAEYKIIPAIAVRAGYSFNDSPINEGILPVSSKISTYSGGVGYRSKNYFMDFAYSYIAPSSYNYYLYDYDIKEIDPNGETERKAVQPSKIDLKNHQVTLTFGWKF